MKRGPVDEDGGSLLVVPDVKWLHVVVAGIALVVVGAVWYAPPVFGKLWMSAVGLSEADLQAARKKAAPGYAVALVGAIVTAYVVSLASINFVATTFIDVVKLAILLWAGFVAFTMATATLFEGRKWTLYWINSLNQLVNLLLAGLIVTLWT